jgi:hypothetical protein
MTMKLRRRGREKIVFGEIVNIPWVLVLATPVLAQKLIDPIGIVFVHG